MPRPGDGAAVNRTSTGIADLDVLLGGGFPSNRAILLCGGTGTGKTTFGLQFLLDGLAHGEHGAFLSVDQKPRHLIEDAGHFEWDLQPAIDKGVLSVLDASPYFTATRVKNTSHPGVDARQVSADLVEAISKIGARRMVIDSLTSLVPPDMPRNDVHDYLRAVIQSIEDNAGCTTLLTCRASRHDPQASCEAARYMTAGVIELRLARQGSQMHRKLRIRKMRGTAVEPAEYPLAIESGWGLLLTDTTPMGASVVA